jgi:TPR repeat protein
MFFWITKLKIKRLTKKIKAMQQAHALNQPTDEMLAKETAAYHHLADIYLSLYGNKNCPFAREMVLACYRASAMLNDSKAQYLVGKNLLEEAKFREELQAGGVFASENNQQQMKECYEEAHAYLLAAEKLEHVFARRLHGLCYINAWGVPEDKNRGFELVVESIQQENSWARVPQIFKEIGLNKPEFFSALTQRRGKR